MTTHNYFPVALNVKGKACLVIGEAHDKETLQKSERLREAGAQLTVVPPANFSLDQIQDQFLVIFCVKTDPTLTEEIAARCKEKRVLLCAIDQPAYCDVVNVSIYDKGRLRMTMGTGGAAPAISRKIRQGLEESLKEVPLDEYLETLAELRKRLEHEIPHPPNRIPHLLKATEGFEFKAHVTLPPDWRKSK
ncbi:MAG: Siroheme synthase [Elusimicrobia bacterium]|nr:Siroheme synthase [Elusimicrobiota bacterium]